MALHFLHDGAFATSVGPGDLVSITGPEAHHAAQVRRVRPGEEVTLGDGYGVWLRGLCAEISPRQMTVDIRERHDEAAPSPRTVLVQALAKGGRDELAVQTATELGIDEVVPWSAARSVSRWDGAKVAKGRARWQSITREAAKQAHRAWVPQVSELIATSGIARRAHTARVLILDPEASLALSEVVMDSVEEIILVVGPEGGITPEERAALVEAGAQPVRLGAHILRTSTAGPAALAVINAQLGRW